MNRIILALILSSLIHAYWVYDVNSRFIIIDPEPVQVSLGLFLGSSVGTIVPMIVVFLFLYLTNMGFRVAYYTSIATFSTLMGAVYVGHFKQKSSIINDNFSLSLVIAIFGIFLILWIFTRPEKISPIRNINEQEEAISDVLMTNSEKDLTEPRISETDNFKANFRNNLETKICPFCAEEVKLKAIKCKHCKSDISYTVENSN